MGKENFGYDLFFEIGSINEGKMEGVELIIPAQIFVDYVSSTLEENGNRVLMGTVLPYLRDRNRIVQYVTNPEPKQNDNNIFNQYDCFMSSDGRRTHPTQLILRESERKAADLYRSSPNMKPLSITGFEPKGLLITDGIIRKHNHHLLYFLPVNEAGYKAMLLRSGRYEQLADIASLEEIEKLINLGTIRPCSDHLESLEKRRPGSLKQSPKLLSKIKKITK